MGGESTSDAVGAVYDDVRSLIAAACDPDPLRRALAADTMTDNVRDRSTSEAEVICRALAALFVVEAAPDAAEAMLHAVAEFDGFDMTPGDALALIVDENRWQTPWAADYVQGFQDSLAERRRR